MIPKMSVNSKILSKSQCCTHMYSLLESDCFFSLPFSGGVDHLMIVGGDTVGLVPDPHVVTDHVPTLHAITDHTHALHAVTTPPRLTHTITDARGAAPPPPPTTITASTAPTRAAASLAVTRTVVRVRNPPRRRRVRVGARGRQGRRRR